jgi:hypothetical protein
MNLVESDYDVFENSKSIKYDDRDPQRLVNSIMRFQFKQMNLQLEDANESLLLLDFMWKWIDGIKPQFKDMF